MVHIEMSVAGNWPGGIEYWQSFAETSCRAAIAHTPFARLIDCAADLEISVQLANDEAVQDMNSTLRGKDKPTNILSFPMLDTQTLHNLAASDMVPDVPEILCGDMILAHAVCVREATNKQISLTHHFQHLVVHGTLHLLGYDHENDVEADIMENLEITILAAMGVANPYDLQDAAAEHVI